MEEIEFKCPSCKEKMIADVDINDIVRVKMNEMLYKMQEELRK